MAMSAENKGKATPTINVTPLIDVLLVLLIIFMVIGPPRKPHKFEAKVPENPTTTPENPNTCTVLVVNLDRTRSLSLNSQPMSPEELGVSLKKVFQELSPQSRTVFIRAPRELPYQAITDVIDLVKAAGASPIGLQVDFLDM